MGSTQQSASVPHLRHILGAAAVGAGLALDDSPCDSYAPGEMPRDAQARDLAHQWGLMAQDPGGHIPGTVVILVDGLGLECLRQRRGHAPRLRALLAESEQAGLGSARTCNPSTTAAALTTLGTGALPGLTGMVGYSVLNPMIDRRARLSGVPTSGDDLCLITWERTGALPVPQPRTWQDVPTIFERLRPAAVHGSRTGILAVSIGPARFAGSGLTEAGLRGAHHLGADLMEQRPSLAAEALSRGVPLVYLYVGELDHAGHGHGWQSEEWLRELERLDAMLDELLRVVPTGTRIILTADHGMIDTDAAHRITVTHHDQLMRGVIGIAGEPRFSQLYVPASDPDAAEEVAARWREFLGDRARWVGAQAQAHELLGPLSERTCTVLGDVLVAMDDAWVVVDPRVHSEDAMMMPGVHGSLTDAECEIPLLMTQA